MNEFFYFYYFFVSTCTFVVQDKTHTNAFLSGSTCNEQYRLVNTKHNHAIESRVTVQPKSLSLCYLRHDSIYN